VVQVRFGQLGLWPRVVHSAASPSVAELLLVAGCLLVVFEFFTAGVGVAATAGAGCLVLASMGLASLPTRPWAVALVVVGCLGFAIDVQAGAPRVWTGIGTVAVAAGAVGLVGREFGPSPWAMGAAVAGTILFMVGGMPAVVRARFSTPTIGRESMVGEMGRATAALSPEGMVQVRDALWRARTNRATPVAAGQAVRVVGVEGLVLQVEPEEDDPPRQEGA
jgi:membrane-bound serine protease (ClpP class)